MAWYWPSSLFALLWTETKSRSIKTQKENNLLYGIPRLHVAQCFYFCVCLSLLQNLFLKLINIFAFFVFILVNAFSVLVFLFHLDREITENQFIVTENILRKKASLHPLEFGLRRNLTTVTKRAIPSGQYQALSCPLGWPITARDLVHLPRWWT